MLPLGQTRCDIWEEVEMHFSLSVSFQPLKYLPACPSEDVYTLGLCTSWLEVKPLCDQGTLELTPSERLIKQWTDIFRQCYSF